MADTPYASAIASIESGGNYGILGPPTKSGDRPYGKYQVMGSNIGPWSKEVLGMELTPQQFLANPQAQDAVFNGKFGQYAAKYGPEGAARAWFAGPRGMNNPSASDGVLTVAQYAQKFNSALGAGAAPLAGPQPQQAAPPQGVPQMVQAAAAGTTPQAQQQQAPMLPALNAPQIQYAPAPQIQYAPRQFNLARAFSKIPVPQGYAGFQFNRG